MSLINVASHFTQCLYWNYSSHIKWWTAGSLVALLTQTSDVGKASSSCASWIFPCVLVFLCSWRWPGWQLSPSLLVCKAAAKTETYSCACFSCSDLLAKVCLPLVGGDVSYLLQAFWFLPFLWGPCAVTFCSASLPFLLHLPLLWSMSQHPRGWNSQCAGTTKDGFPKAEPQSGFDSSSFEC